nr:hypothetical protein [Tanacetum cinerariifolium]
TKRYACHMSPISPLPKSYTHAFNDPHWYHAMLDEYNALIKNKTWILVPRPHNVNIVRCLWLFRHKHNADGSLNRYKARLVVNGSSQLAGFDLDVKNAFLNDYLSKTGYMQQPLGSQDSQHPDYVCLLQRSLYGLKQALRAWFQRFAAYAARVGFHHSRCDTSLFIYRHGTNIAYLLLYKYATEVLERAGMLTCNPCRTPVDTDSKLSADGNPVSDPTLYRSLAGALQYLTFTRPDISYAVQHVCLFMHDPLEPYFQLLNGSCIMFVVPCLMVCNFTHPRTLLWLLIQMRIGLVVPLHFTISRSSVEAKYRGVANAVAETCWLRNLLRELHTPLSTATLVYCDNVSAVYLFSTPVQHQRTKHIEIDIHFVRDLVSTGRIRVLHVPSHYQHADIFTKGLRTTLFDEFRSSLSVRSSPAQTAGGC